MDKMTFDNQELKEVVFSALKDKIGSAINYQEMHSLIEEVITERKPEIKTLLDECFDAFFADPGMKQAIIDEFQHKVAKNLVAKLEGTVEKSVNDYRNDPTLRAKLILGIERILEESK